MPTEKTALTRRETIKYGGALAAGLGMAGCSEVAEQSGESGGSGTPTGTGSYTVEMAPAGEVTFDSVPETFTVYDGGYADMAVALGQADGIVGMGNGSEFYTYPYEELPGVSVPQETIDNNAEVRTKEGFYALDTDVNIYDPQMLVNWFDWSEDDIEEVTNQSAPFIGNLIFRRSDEWHDYRYYTLYEAFEKLSQVFQEQERYEAFSELHDEFITSVQDRLPPESERPTVFLTYEGTNEPETFSPYRLDDKGTSKKQWRDLGAHDALADTDISQLSTTDRGELDYENLIEIDPEVILVRGHERKTPQEFRDTVLEYMQDHSVGSELQAVQNGQVYRGGSLRQGPIHNLFLTERAAKQLYPDEFGDVTSDAELFDRQRVADIVTGEFENA